MPHLVLTSHRSSPKKTHGYHGHQREQSGCKCSILNLLFGATIFVALNILFSYSFLRTGSGTSDLTPPVHITVEDPRGKPAVTQTSSYSKVNITGGAVLPAFSIDDSEIFMGSIIERSGRTLGLHLTTFMLCHHMLSYDVSKAVHKKALVSSRLNRTMENSGKVQYKENGQRSDKPFFICKIKNSKSDSVYVVPGFFVPNRQNFDPNANRRLDILRCNMEITGDSMDRILKYLEKDAFVQVEIFRDHQTLLQFEVPWRTRRLGYMLASPPIASRWNAWEGIDSFSRNRMRNLSGAKNDAVFLCAPALRRPPNRISIGPLLEFIEHHLSIGVEHIFLGVAFSWQSTNMDALLQILRSYIVEGSVSIISEASDGIDYSSSFLGIRFSRADTKAFFNNMCLYLSKGSSAYSGFWDVDEFFIPPSASDDLPSVVARAHRTQNALRTRGPTPNHPVCYLSISTQDFFPLYPAGYAEPWVGARFAHNPPVKLSRGRALVPTDVIFNAGILTAGTCFLESHWTDCPADDGHDFCVTGGASSNPVRVHNFDQRMGPEDVFSLPPELGLLHHYQTYSGARVVSSDHANSERNRYSSLFYPAVLSELRRRGLEALISLPIADLEAPVSSNEGWNELLFHTASLTVKDEKLSDTILDTFFDIDSKINPDESEVTFGADEYLSLPEFAVDFSELFLSSLIEREFESPRLRLTVFLMNHAQLLRNAVSGVNIISINRTMKPVWDKAMRAFVNAKYLPTGERSQQFHCRIALHANSSSDVFVKGRFIPNRLTPDANANRKLDILRCPFDVPFEKLTKLHDSDEKLHITLYRDTTQLIKFTVPWKGRRSGYMLNSPRGGSGFDAWKGVLELYNKNLSSVKELNNNSIDNLYMCVPGMESPFDKRVLPLYSEFIEHHIQLGVQHLFIAATYDMNGQHMKLLAKTFRSYIKEGLMTLSSQAGDSEDFRYGFKGLTVDRDNIKVMFVNMCLYLAKGSADYVAIWDFDEFFIPKLPHNTILDVIKSAEGSSSVQLPRPGEDITGIMEAWETGPGVADGDGHPFCYIIVNSETINSDGDTIDPDNPWIGERFSHDTEVTHLSFQKSILPTRKIFQAGLHLGGACKLPFPWNGCSLSEIQSTEFCFRAEKSVGIGALNKVTWLNDSYFIDFMRFHAFDEGTTVEDAKRLDIRKDAIIYHIQAHRAHLVSGKEALSGPVNEYASRFFKNVLNKLRIRGIKLLQTLPQSYPKDILTASSYWDPLIPLLDSSFKGPVGFEKNTAFDKQKPLPGIFWEPTETSLGKDVELPSFSEDGKEFVLGSVIERVSDSFDLYLTSFFLGHDMLDTSKRGDLHGSRVAASVKNKWISYANYSRSFSRDEWNAHYYCHIKNSPNDGVYVVMGHFVPNRGTPDANANRRLDILRCPLRQTRHIYEQLRNSSGTVVVELFRDNIFLMRFGVPLRSRKVGHGLTAPDKYSMSDAWKGANELIAYDEKGFRNKSELGPKTAFGRSSGRDMLYMCVPGLESRPDKKSVALYLEFIQHHLLLGVQHIYIGTIFSWGSTAMEHLFELLSPYIEEGTVSISSQASDGIDGVYSTQGLTWFRDNAKVFFVNMCVYHAKGNADYVGIWDFDEFFIPKPPHNNIIDVIRSVEGGFTYHQNEQLMKKTDSRDIIAEKEKYKGGPGMADGHAHPFCFIMLSSLVVANDNENGMGRYPWIGQRFTHSPELRDSGEYHMAFKKSIVPTERIFQVGLHMHGACRVPHSFNGCNNGSDFCFSKNEKERMGILYSHNGTLVDFSVNHTIDGIVWDNDAKKVNAETQGVIYHFQVHRQYLAASAASLNGSTNDYTRHFFPQVMRKLSERGFLLLEAFPEQLGEKPVSSDPSLHLPYKKILSDFLDQMMTRDFFP